jgi:cysteine desulfurase
MKPKGKKRIIGYMKRIYLDNASTTRISKTAIDAMTPYFQTLWANPSGVHSSSAAARAGYEDSRKKVAGIIGCGDDEIIFTSSGSEANCLAVKGAARANADRGRHIISSSAEHKSVMLALEELCSEGFEVTYIDPGKDGITDAEKVRAAIRDDTTLVCVMYANNETGAVQPVKEISRVAHAGGALFFTDAVQAAGALPLDASLIGADMLSLSGHKINAPKGIGALYVKNGTRLRPLINGSQERGLRGGTENAAFAASFAAALCEARDRISDTERVAALRDMLYRRIKAGVPDVVINGSPTSRLPGILNLTFKGVQNDGLLHLLDIAGIEASAGSACEANAREPSHVLLSMGLSAEEANSSVRFSLCRDNTEEEIRRAAETVSDIIKKLRSAL